MLGGVRGGPDVPHLRRDRWWRTPAATVAFLTVFVVYSTWAVFQNAQLLRGRRRAPRPHLALVLAVHHRQLRARRRRGFVLNWWRDLARHPGRSVVPVGFRLTCYYYRKAYYRGFWQSPPACGVADGHAQLHAARPASRSSCRTCTATSSSRLWSSTSSSPSTPSWPSACPVTVASA